MKFGDKDFSYYWQVIKVPVYLLIAWTAAAFIVAEMNIEWYLSIFTGVASYIIQAAIFSYVGYAIVAEHKGEVRHAAWAGALTGVIVGFAGAILSVLMPYLGPAFFEYTIKQATAEGASEAVVRQMIKIGLYVGLVIGPLFSGIFGAIISSIAGLITKKTKK